PHIFTPSLHDALPICRSRFVKRFLTGTALVFGKELRVELRTREILVTAGLFGLLVTVLTSLAFFLDDVTSQKIAPGVLWVSACLDRKSTRLNSSHVKI